MYLFNRYTRQCDAFEPDMFANNLFAEHCNPSLIVPCKQCFSARANAPEGEATQISGIYSDRSTQRQSAADISGLYFRSDPTRHGSTVAPPHRRSVPLVHSLSLSVSLSLYRVSTPWYKGRQSQNTITGGIE